MEQYSEELNTISLYPQELYAEDLTPECGEEIDNICEEIHKACKGWGTSEKRLIEAIGNTTEYDRKLLSLRFEKTFGKDLKKYMKSECGNNGFGQALQYLSLGPVETECRMLKKAVDGLGTNEVMLYSILCGRSNEDMELLKKTYYKLYTDDLVSRMSGEVGGDMKKILLSAVQVRNKALYCHKVLSRQADIFINNIIINCLDKQTFSFHIIFLYCLMMYNLTGS